MKIDRRLVENIHAELDSRIAEINKLFGMAGKSVKAKFNESNITFTVEFSVVAETGVAMTRGARAFILNANALGMKHSDLGKKFTIAESGRTYELVGYDSRRPKFPFQGRDVDTKKDWKFTERAVKFALGYEVK